MICTHMRQVLHTLQGLATIRMLYKLEQTTGKRVHELFDLICGTSTGGILAASLALQQFTLADVQDIYRCELSCGLAFHWLPFALHCQGQHNAFHISLRTRSTHMI